MAISSDQSFTYKRILGFGEEIEIISPWELRNTLKDKAAKMACLYKSK